MHAHVAYPSAHQAVDPRFASVDCLFFVIGAQKAGTTWLSRYLREHPNATVPYWKENNYWNMVEGRKSPGRMLEEQRKRRESDGWMRKAAAQLPFTMHAKRQRAITLALRAAETAYPPHSGYADVVLANVNSKTRAAGELCPQYALLTEETYAAMSDLSENTKFVFMMRDPVSRAISGARHALRKGPDGDACDSEELGQMARTMANRKSIGRSSYSSYDRTIKKLESVVPAKNIAYVFFEELFQQSEVDRICKFLGLPCFPGNFSKKRNDAGEYSVALTDEDLKDLARMLKPVYDFALERFGADLPKKWQESAKLC